MGDKALCAANAMRISEVLQSAAQFSPSQVRVRQEAQRLSFTERAPRTAPDLGCTAKFVSGADGNQMEVSP